MDENAERGVQKANGGGLEAKSKRGGRLCGANVSRYETATDAPGFYHR